MNPNLYGIGLDLGEYTGFAAMASAGMVIEAGVWHLSSGRKCHGLRYVMLSVELDQLVKRIGHAPAQVAIERTAYSTLTQKGRRISLAQARWQTAVEIWCAQNNAPLVIVPCEKVKKLATGYARAKKREMIDAAKREWDVEWPKRAALHEHQADAMWCAARAVRLDYRKF